MLGLIAINCQPSDAFDDKKIEDFFVEQLNFKKVDEEHRVQRTYDELLSRAVRAHGEVPVDDDCIFTDDEGESGESELDENEKAF